MEASDSDIWTYAGAFGFTIVTKDNDFSAMSLERGSPPSVIWIRVGNCPTWKIASIIREATEQIKIHVQFGGAVLQIGTQLTDALTQDT